MTAGNNKALIIFSRLPIGHETKNRLAPLLNETQRSELHISTWRDVFRGSERLVNDTDIFLYWTGSGDINEYLSLVPSSFALRRQEGDNLGEKMRNAMRDIFALKYELAAIAVRCHDTQLRKSNCKFFSNDSRFSAGARSFALTSHRLWECP